MYSTVEKVLLQITPVTTRSQRLHLNPALLLAYMHTKSSRQIGTHRDAPHCWRPYVSSSPTYTLCLYSTLRYKVLIKDYRLRHCHNTGCNSFPSGTNTFHYSSLTLTHPSFTLSNTPLILLPFVTHPCSYAFHPHLKLYLPTLVWPCWGLLKLGGKKGRFT